ncbi:hypothetical protein [Novosphingobium sp. Chol11]|uniref:hypothetical protein n=1 Tax=Novosphingobium sp. Chol11 TaxID=1385763 RepID=UPI0025DC6683|nr:hypothetical protein [Novosphingobium sp. Chol11]
MAFSAALLTVSAIRRQINQADRLHENERQQRHNASRAIMPLVLSEISDFCLKIATAVSDEIEARGFGEKTDWLAELAPDESSKVLPSQQFLTTAIPALQSFIQSLTDQENIRHIAELIGSLQILTSRYRSLNLYQVDAVISLYGLLLDTAKVRMLAHSIFNYARFVDQSPFGLVGPTPHVNVWDKIHGEAHGLLFSRKNCDQFFLEISSRIKRYKEHDYTPWNARSVE